MLSISYLYYDYDYEYSRLSVFECGTEGGHRDLLGRKKFGRERERERGRENFPERRERESVCV